MNDETSDFLPLLLTWARAAEYAGFCEQTFRDYTKLFPDRLTIIRLPGTISVRFHRDQVRAFADSLLLDAKTNPPTPDAPRRVPPSRKKTKIQSGAVSPATVERVKDASQPSPPEVDPVQNTGEPHTPLAARAADRKASTVQIMCAKKSPPRRSVVVNSPHSRSHAGKSDPMPGSSSAGDGGSHG